MPWKESSVMEERLRFVARLLDGEPMTDMCREFGISGKTGCAAPTTLNPARRIGRLSQRSNCRGGPEPH